MIGLGHMRMYARFAGGLRRFLAQTSSLDEARVLLAGRLAGRTESFLRVAERGIYGHPRSPYLALLRRAGCELGDLRAMVRAEGLEATLARLRREGVYVSFEEWKGRQPLIRRGLELEVGTHDFDNPHLRKAYEASTGGSTGVGTRLALDLDDIAARAPISHLVQHALGIAQLPRAIVFGTLPDPTGVNIVLSAARSGQPIERWFRPQLAGAPRAALQYRMTHHYVLRMARLLGVPIPAPEPLPLDEAVTVARWAARRRDEAGGAVVSATASMAVRICVAAVEAGLALDGVVFSMGGEPTTPAKARAIAAAGARPLASYHMSEVGAIGRGCGQSADPNDQHFLADHLALIQWPRVCGDVEVGAFLLTTLLPTAKRILLNVEIDDYGTVEASTCGCGLEHLGYTTALRGIRSWSKLTAEGVTLVGSEMEHILETVLPARFGGSALDYQLVEEEDGQGFTRVYVVVSPRVDVADETAIVGAVLEALERGSLGAAISGSLWSQVSALRVRRAEPILTARGKLIPLRSVRAAGAGAPGAASVEEIVA